MTERLTTDEFTIDDRHQVETIEARDRVTGLPVMSLWVRMLRRAINTIDRLVRERDRAREMVALHHIDCGDPDCAKEIASWPPQRVTPQTREN